MDPAYANADASAELVAFIEPRLEVVRLGSGDAVAVAECDMCLAELLEIG
jgi:hypothetical protein